MTQREREFLTQDSTDRDPHSFLFGDDDDETTGSGERLTRADRRRNERGRARSTKRRGGLFFVLLAVVLVAAVALLVVPRVIDHFAVADYSGSGTAGSSVSVVVRSDDSLKDMGETLYKNKVVKSVEAFTDATSNNSAAQNIQPGIYALKLHMSGKAALAAMLAGASRTGSNDVLVTEGATTLDVKARLIKLFGADKTAAIDAAFTAGSDSNLPLNYTGKGDGVPTSVEGFLYPATYTVDPGTTPQKVVQTMVTRYLAQDRQMSFAIDAKKVGLTPYQALIVASIAQSEAKFVQDMPKVVRTILNRLASNTPLQFDSTSSYACKLAGTPATSCIYHQVVSPFNTYTHEGLPPTPIDNPGADALNAAVHPAAGTYQFFVNIDAAGHLGFFATAKEFEAARVKCVKNNWGCG